MNRGIADEGEILVAIGSQIGVDGREIDPVFANRESRDRVGIDPWLSNSARIDERVASRPAIHMIAAKPAIELVIAAAPGKRVIAEATGQTVVEPLPAISSSWFDPTTASIDT